MNRTEALQLWQRIAAGELEDIDQLDPVDLHAWVRQVANQLLEADNEPSAGKRRSCCGSRGTQWQGRCLCASA